MPRTVTIVVPDPTPTSPGLTLHVRRSNGRTVLELEGTGDPDGPFQILATQLAAAEQTALQTVLAAVLLQFHTARGYV